MWFLRRVSDNTRVSALLGLPLLFSVLSHLYKLLHLQQFGKVPCWLYSHHPRILLDYPAILNGSLPIRFQNLLMFIHVAPVDTQ